jgi:hypothetical protein
MLDYERVLRIDLDDKEEKTKKRFLWAIGLLSKYHKFEQVEVFETNRGFHIYLCLKERVDPILAMLLQQLLGSDRDREVYNYIRYKKGHKRWQILFSKKYYENGILRTSEERKTQDAVEFELAIKITLLEGAGDNDE